MNGLDWNAIYLTCFGIGLVLSLLSFFGGFGHLHLGHFHFGGAHAQGHGGNMSPINGFTVMAFLCWFGGAGYLMHRGGVFGATTVLLLSVVSGLAGSAVLAWFLIGVLLPGEHTLEAADTEMTGVIGQVSAPIPAKGVGEILYVQNSSRRSAVVRSDDGKPIEHGAEVIVMRYERGVAYVRRWDEFEHGLMVDGPGRPLEKERKGEGSGTRETARPE